MLRIKRMGSTHWMDGHRRHYIHISCTSHKHSCSTDNTVEACQDRRKKILHFAQKTLIPKIQCDVTANTISETHDNTLTSVPSHIPDIHQWSEECCDLQTAVMILHWFGCNLSEILPLGCVPLLAMSQTTSVSVGLAKIQNTTVLYSKSSHKLHLLSSQLWSTFCTKVYSTTSQRTEHNSISAHNPHTFS